MKGLLSHTIGVFEICRTLYDFALPIIDTVDNLYWASDNTSPVDTLWLMEDSNEELYFKYRIKFGETITDYDELPPEFSIIKKEDYAIYRPNMLKAYGSQLVLSEGDTNVYFGIKANSINEACSILSRILISSEHSRPRLFDSTALIESGTIFVSDISNVWWRIFANDIILDSLKAKARFQYKEIDSTSQDEEMATRYVYKLI